MRSEPILKSERKDKEDYGVGGWGQERPNSRDNSHPTITELEEGRETMKLLTLNRVEV